VFGVGRQCVIYDELRLGVVLEQSRAAYREVIHRLVDRGAKGNVLGCTEIGAPSAGGERPATGSPGGDTARRRGDL